MGLEIPNMPDFGLATTPQDFLDLLEKCGGYYECPKDASGKRLGPLVGYAGTYDDDGEKKHLVGDVYCNFAQLEQWPDALRMVAYRLWIDHWSSSPDEQKLLIETPTLLIGMPMGGIMLAAHLGRESSVRTIFADKKGDDLIIARHEIKPGDQVVIVEDVCNNFSTTNKALNLIVEADAICIGITCFLNRSCSVGYEFVDKTKGLLIWDMPVVSLVQKQFDQYRQNNPEVAADVEAGNVVWKPKHDWGRLKAAMDAAK